MRLTSQHISVSKPKNFEEIDLVPVAIVTPEQVFHGEVLVMPESVVFKNELSSAIAAISADDGELLANKAEVTAAVQRAVGMVW